MRHRGQVNREGGVFILGGGEGSGKASVLTLQTSWDEIVSSNGGTCTIRREETSAGSCISFQWDSEQAVSERSAPFHGPDEAKGESGNTFCFFFFLVLYSVFLHYPRKTRQDIRILNDGECQDI